VQAQRLQRTATVSTSFSSPGPIGYPGLFVCPSPLTVQNAAIGSNITISSMAGAEFIPYRPYDPDSSTLGYSVCPRTVVFPTTDGKFVQCVDYPPNPPYSLAMTQNNPDTCPDVNPQAFWYKASTTVADPVAGVWTASNIGNGMYIGFGSENIFNEPYMVLLYSAATRLQPPTTFTQYAKMFDLTNFFLAHLPLMSYSAVNVDKIVTDNFPSDSDCSHEGFLSAIDQFTFSEAVSTERYASILLGFDILEVVTTCHSPVLAGTDVLGIIGGGIALVLAVTIAFQLVVNKFLGVKPAPEDTNMQGSNYRPLAGDNL